MGKDISDISILKDSGISIYKGLSLFYIVCVKGYNNIVCYLLDKGVDINVCDNDGKSFLYLMSEYGYVNVIEILLGGCVDVNFCDNDGVSLLFIVSY